MVVQFPLVYIDGLISAGRPLVEIFQSILCHSHDDEEREELLLCDFIMSADLSTIDEDIQYSINISNETNH